jgi:hypothetical protein
MLVVPRSDIKIRLIVQFGFFLQNRWHAIPKVTFLSLNKTLSDNTKCMHGVNNRTEIEKAHIRCLPI